MEKIENKLGTQSVWLAVDEGFIRGHHRGTLVRTRTSENISKAAGTWEENAKGTACS